MNFELSDENRLIRETIRDIAQNVIAPNAKHVDETGEFPYENFKALADAGFMGLV